jgi:neutral ceramidase
MNRRHLVASFLALVSLSALALLVAQEEKKEPVPKWKAGCATAKITPGRPMPMSGYAGRKDNPAEGTEQDLFAKALAIEDAEGNRVVIVTTDLIGIIAKYRTDVETAVAAKFNLPRESLVMNASHTHCGPSYGRDDTQDYYDELLAKTVEIIGQALGSMEPSRVSYSSAKCGFAMNRRTPTPDGFRNHPNPEGVVDHTVPVLSVRNAAGELKTVLFGYSCHNTTMGFMKWLGDYAGYAQEYFEADHEGVTAMFMNGCSGDQNPYPRGMLYFAQRHGRSLATAIEAALETNQTAFFHQHELNGSIQSVFETVNIPFTEESKRGAYDYPVQVVKFGNGLAMIGLGGEVTVDYSLRLKRELGSEEGPAIWVSGYTNDYNGYVPSKRVLLEGGYEAKSRPWQPVLEELIVEKVHALYKGLKLPNP